MKISTIVSIASLLLASLPAAQSATTLAAWSFDNLPIGATGSPGPAAGFGTASAVGMNNTYNPSASVSNPDILGLTGSSGGNTNAWRITGNQTGGNGWSTNAPIGTQGARFAASTAGFYKVKATFDVYATPAAEANLQVQYTTEGTIWLNATNLTLGGLGSLQSNADPANSTVVGTYVSLASGYNTLIMADFTGISGVDNNPNFAIRIVNASTGTNCPDTTGSAFNNATTTGNWSFDNVVVQGTSIDTVAAWTFESYGTKAFVPSPVPEFGTGSAQSIGFNTSFHFADGTVGSTNKPDVLAQAGSSTPNGTFCWRVRGQGPGNGWFSQSPIGSQGAEFDASTVNYNDVVVSFDLYFTTQAEAKMQVQYTTNGTVWNNAPMLAYAANPTFIQTNTTSPDTVMGTYFFETTGQNWYNNLVVDFTGVPGVAGNPLFGIRIVNAAQNGDCVAYNSGSYNNASGNCRFDNVTVGGTYTGLTPPALTYDPAATVDRPFTNTFNDDATWRSKITAIYVNGSALTNSAYTTNTSGKIVFTPAKSVLLQSSGIKSIVIYATGYGNAKVTQPLGAGVAAKLSITTQAAAPTASGGTLVANPVLGVTDQYGNGTTVAPNTNVTVSAAVGGSGAWTLGGATNQAAVNGFAVFSNLTATVNGLATVTGAYITFTVSNYNGAGNVCFTNSALFNIGALTTPFTRGNLAVIQLDTVANNTTFSVIEVKPSVAGQTVPVSITPISATGPNALRLASAGSAGKLSLSDDGTLVTFLGFADDNSATVDQTFNLNRAVGTLNYTNLFNQPVTYTSTSLGGSEGRSCTTLDNRNYVIDDKAFLYLSGLDVTPNAFDLLNNVVVRAFGGKVYVETQKTTSSSPIPTIYGVDLTDLGNPSYDVTLGNGLGTDPVANDFYMISTNGSTYDILYVLDGTSSSIGAIRKYSNVGGSWVANGAFTNGTGGDSLFATTNGNGGVYLYYTTGTGAGNSIVRVTDSVGWNLPINIVSSNVIYTATAGTSIKGLTFVPQQTAYAAELIPPPVLTAQTAAAVSSQFSITNTPDDPTWRSAITAVTVNGAILPLAAYDKTQSGKIVFNPAQSTFLQTNGTKTIVISATGYSTNSITQTLLAGPAASLTITTQPAAPLADGGLLAVQPVVVAKDGYGNLIASSINITSAAVQGAWTLGGVKNLATTAGTATYAGLTAFSSNAVTGATLSFTSGALTVTSAGFNIPAPILSNLRGATLAGGRLAFAFTNATGLSFSVLATNNIAAPKATWPVIGAAVEGPAGTYKYTNSAPATNGLQYYILRQP